MLVKGENELKSGDKTNALATMETAFEIPGIRDKNIISSKFAKLEANSSMLNFSEKDRCGIFLIYAKSLAQNGEHKKAKQIMTKAIGEFSGTSEEVNVLISNSEIAISGGDIKKAISILKSVGIDSKYFCESRKLLADVYLTHLKDRRNYAKCYQELIIADESFNNYNLLGDALMKIYEPEEAVFAYEAAIKLQNDENTVSKLGKALCLTHDYEKAI